MEDYQQNYEKNWKHIVENEDGTLNKDQIMRELADFHFMLEEVPKVYSEFAELSKPNYYAQTIIDEINQRYVHREYILDDFKEMAEDGYLSLEEIEEYLRI